MKAIISKNSGTSFLKCYSLLTQNASHSFSSLRHIVKRCPLQTRQGNCKMQEQTSKTDRTQFCCGLYFSQEMFIIVSETYMHYLLAKNKMEPKAGVIKWTKKVQDMNQCKIPAYHTVRDSAIRLSWHYLAFSFRHL
jgi:hypothetical protein